MSQALKFAQFGRAQQLYVDDVFSTYPYRGNGSTQTINNGIDLVGKGGMVWIKDRSFAYPHRLLTTALTDAYALSTNTTGAAAGGWGAYFDFNSDGFGFPTTYQDTNKLNDLYISWTFRNAPKFYGHGVVTKSAGSNATVSFPELGTLGMVRVKRTDSDGSWYVWHRSLTAGKLLIGETTAAEATLGHITVSGTTVTLVNGVIADGTYLVEAFAHDDSADGIIQCGSFVPSGGIANVNLGREVQFVIYKRAATLTGDWHVLDTMRGFDMGSADAILFANAPSTENKTSGNLGNPTASGFLAMPPDGSADGSTYIYLAIRRPNKPPTSGTQVYYGKTRTGTGTAVTVTDPGFPPDLIINSKRESGTSHPVFDRLRGVSRCLFTDRINAEASLAEAFTSFDMNGYTVGTSTSVNDATSSTYVDWVFRRAPGVFDQACFGGTGANKTEAHNLTVPAELWRVKRRNGTGSWVYGSSLLANTQKIACPSPAGAVTDATAWNSTYPTATNISLGTLADVNAAGGTYVVDMWATLAGISKVGLAVKSSGANLDVNCGFSAGARFVMMVRTDAAGDIYLWDSARGIVAGNDPYLRLNSNAAEVTTTDYIDPYNPGFTIVDGGLPNGTYLYLAYA